MNEVASQVSYKETRRGNTQRQVTVTGDGETISIPGAPPFTPLLAAVVSTTVAYGADGGYYREQPRPTLDLSMLVASSAPEMTRANWETYKKLVDEAFTEYERRWSTP
jgi:hypothetical protein